MKVSSLKITRHMQEVFEAFGRFHFERLRHRRVSMGKECRLNIRNESNLTGSDNIGVTEQASAAPAVASDDDDDDGGDDDSEPARSASKNQLPQAVRHFDQLPAVARLRTREVLILAGISRATLYRRIEAETFPKPQKTPTGTCFWTAATVRAALEAEVAE